MNRIPLKKLDDFFLSPTERVPAGAFGVYMSGAAPSEWPLLGRYAAEAVASGAAVSGRPANPDEAALNRWSQKIGDGFEPERGWMLSAMRKWLPELPAQTAEAMADGLEASVRALQAARKPQTVLRSGFLKLMCWLNGPFRRAMKSGAKTLLIGAPGQYEQMLIDLLQRAGSDVLVLVPGGAAQGLDGLLERYAGPGAQPFAPTLSLKEVMAAAPAPQRAAPNPVRSAQPAPQRTAPPQRPNPIPSQRPNPVPPQRPAAPAAPPIPKPQINLCTNAWMEQAELAQILTPPGARSAPNAQICNAFLRVNGVQDKLTYVNELYQMGVQLRGSRRRLAIVDGQLELPKPDEVAKVSRGNARDADALIRLLAANLQAGARTSIQPMLMYAFGQVMLDEAKREPNLNRLMTTGVTLICWIRRWKEALFGDGRDLTPAVFMWMNGPCTPREALFARMLAGLPVDVVSLSPDRALTTPIEDERLLTLDYPDVLAVPRFPTDGSASRMQTVAAAAEGELDTLLYNDGLYRDRQFARAEAVPLQTTYDEIRILWRQELKYRPNFSVNAGQVTLPVLFARVSGVRDGKLPAYWQSIRELTGEGVYYRDALPVAEIQTNPAAAAAKEWLRGGRLLRDRIRGHRLNPWGLLREETQDFMFDGLQSMLDQRLIRGTFENGTEFRVLSTALALPKPLLRMVQSFDFTKCNPKVVCVCAEERAWTIDDAIMLTFLHKLGFDVVLFVPTGYQTIEPFLNALAPQEHQLGGYVYDLRVPDLSTLPQEGLLGRMTGWLRGRG